MPDILVLSQQLLLATKMGEAYAGYMHALAEADEKVLTAALPTDAERKTFWLNVYNAFTQISLLKDPDQYRHRRRFYARKQIQVAGKWLSLEDVEHGILRRSKAARGFGYFNKWFVSAFERKHRVEKLDPRIHFALNCGAQSCPPIRFYEPGQIDAQLNLATESYLSETVEYRESTQEVWLPLLFLWFAGDFDGRKGTLHLLRHYRLIPSHARPRVRYSHYDWQLRLNHFE